jgi:hypothetical protein
VLLVGQATKRATPSFLLLARRYATPRCPQSGLLLLRHCQISAAEKKNKIEATTEKNEK